MSGIQVDHLALTVESLRQAENFYSRLFGLRVCFREGRSGETWGQWPGDWGWDEVRAADVSLERSCLECDGLRLMLLLRTSEQDPQGRIGYVCLRLTKEEVRRLQQVAEELGCQVECIPSGCSIVDPYGICWKLAATVEE